MKKHIQYFLPIIITVSVLIIASLGYAYRNNEMVELINIETGNHENTSLQFMSSIWPTIATEIQTLQTLTPKYLAQHPLTSEFTFLVNKYFRFTNVARVNIYTLSGKTLLSAVILPRISTHDESYNTDKVNTIQISGSNTNIATRRAELHGTNVVSRINLTLPGNRAIVAILEIITDVSIPLESIRITQSKILYILTGSLLLLAILLFPIIRRADTQIRYYKNTVQEQLERVKYHKAHDIKTGLPNYAEFLTQLESGMKQAEASNSLLAVLIIGIENIEKIHEILGYLAGEDILKEAALRLKNCLDTQDIVARLSGNDIAVCVTSIRVIDQLELLIEKIQNTLSEPYEINNHQFHLHTNTGFALHPFDHEDASSLVSKAVVAMHHIKPSHRKSYGLFDPRMRKSNKIRYSMENSLRHALDRDQFELYYQPIISLATGAVSGVETLLRWNSPNDGLVQPTDFIPILEDTGLIVPVGQWVLKTACEQNAIWSKQGISDIVMNVNISAIQFSRREIIHQVREAIEIPEFRSYLLDLEITESLLIEGDGEVISTLDIINEMGVSLSIDDFGIGYSSLSYLKRMPINTLKIDRCFINEINSNTEDAAIVDAICALSNALRLKVVAEGIENMEQLNYIKNKGVTSFQGYLISPPVPASEVETFLRAKSLLNFPDYAA